MDNTTMVIIACSVGFIVYLLSAKKVLGGVQIREGGESIIYLMTPAVLGTFAGFATYFVIKFLM